MMSGTIVGGWEYVYAAYALTALILVGYAVSVVVRYRQELARRARPEADNRPS
jgi:heme exporter protein D